jgi:hypothetical protein
MNMKAKIIRQESQYKGGSAYEFGDYSISIRINANCKINGGIQKEG